MAQTTVKRDTITRNAALKVCWTGDECHLAIGHFAETAESTGQQNAICCSVAISACGVGCGWHWGYWPDGCEHSAAWDHHWQRRD